MNEIVADHLKHLGKLGYAAWQKLAHALIKKTQQKTPHMRGFGEIYD